MSLYILSNDKYHVKSIYYNYSNLYVDTEFFDFGNIYLCMTSGYKDFFYSNQKKNIFLIGLAFSKWGINNKLIELFKDYDDFKKNFSNQIFGHYTLIFVEEKKTLIVSDKIGMINNFHYSNQSYYYISNDITLFALVSDPQRFFDLKGVKQFILNESTVGERTILHNVKRVLNNKTIQILDDHYQILSDKPLKIESMSVDKYIVRLREYFKLLNDYSGSISCDISAGYDSRLVTSIAQKNINSISLNTNTNFKDGGIDYEIAFIIAERLGLSCKYLENDIEVDKKSLQKVLRGTASGRNVFRSRNMHERYKKKFSHFKLVLGGYGGEVIRASYNLRNNSMKNIVNKNYNGILSDFLRFDIKKSISYDLESYSIPSNLKKTNVSNYYYLIDRMRIWGGSNILMQSLYGDVLHPFMDWHLINPILDFDMKVLKNAKLQIDLINVFSNELKGIPFNKKMSKSETNKEILFKSLQKKVLNTFFYRKFVIHIKEFYAQKKPTEFIDYETDLESEIKFDWQLQSVLQQINKSNNPNLQQRLKTVYLLWIWFMKG